MTLPGETMNLRIKMLQREASKADRKAERAWARAHAAEAIARIAGRTLRAAVREAAVKDRT